MENETFLGAFTLVSGIFGCFTNWSVVLFSSSVPSLRSSFGVLSAHGSFATAIYCTIAVFWIAPLMLVDIDWLLKYSHYAGFVLYLCYDLATETHLLICLNRFCAVWYPHKYPVFFSTNSSFFLLAALWIFCVLISITVFPLSGCQMYYEKSLNTLVYTFTPECQKLTFVVDFQLHMIVVFVMIILNSLTFYQFRRQNKAVSVTLNHASSRRKAKSERNFLMQTFIQESGYTVALLSYFLLVTVIENELLRFIIILLPWYFVHAFEGMVTILCNPELKNICF
ncbi:hypothetical protein GCK72_018022 [Caenorhabditis remanei]|uniref:G-protein coupled receptors family 1 profile domain-containing protein n=1 Tax=Caenorhabditis remanei TaxID=31234 RepID=A0A6A5G8Q2_CAERE|nr:hypothetical protein GCK72_018022 [Caenorhabditis remanei]KAF1751468.1 hypothetical protein GCK72_018022 [Caenorhabditis remanei]